VIIEFVSASLHWRCCTLVVDIAGHLMADRGACVSDCGAGRHANSDGKCVPCDGPCPKSELSTLYIAAAAVFRLVTFR